MHITFSVNANTDQEARLVQKCVYEALCGSYAVTRRGGEDSFAGSGVVRTEIVQLGAVESKPAKTDEATTSKLKIEIDTSEVDAALEKVEALGKAYWRSQIASGSVEELQGFTTGYAIDPLESAINNTAALLADEVERMHERAESGRPAGRLAEVFGQYLDKLLAIQLERVRE